MPVVRNDFRPQGEQLFIEPYVAAERQIRRIVVQVARMLAENRLPTAAQRESRFELSAHRKNGMRTRQGQFHRLRRVAAGPAYRQFSAIDDAGYRIVAADVDRAVMHQEHVGDVLQTLHGVIIFVGNRLLGPVAACHHQRNPVKIMQQQVMQRRIRQHDAEERVVRRHALGDGAADALCQEHDRASRGLQ